MIESFHFSVLRSPFSVFRFLAIIAFLGVFSSGIFIKTVKAQQLEKAENTAQISEIEIKGTSDLESSQIMFLIESQVGEPLDRKMIRRDIHSIFQMNLFDDVTAEVELQDEDYSGFKGYLLRFLGVCGLDAFHGLKKMQKEVVGRPN